MLKPLTTRWSRRIHAWLDDRRPALRSERPPPSHKAARRVWDASATSAQQPDTVLVARTGSPRQTLQSFLSLTRELAARLQDYREDQTRANLNRIIALEDPVFAHLDLSQVAAASRRGAADAASSALFDILARVDLPPMESVPDSDAFDESAPGKWRLPHTPITIARVDEGPRAGEFLFSARTVATAPSFFERIRHLPLRRPSPVEYWTETLPQLHGPMIPVTLVEALPDSLKKRILDTPIWKILLSVAALGLAAILLVLCHLLNTPATVEVPCRDPDRQDADPSGGHCARLGARPLLPSGSQRSRFVRLARLLDAIGRQVPGIRMAVLARGAHSLRVDDSLTQDPRRQPKR